ncbi:thiopeptide-type bacteriocin biosynthesis protein [Halobacillus sp. H74]|uniref:thiopeptide-type bacteriocin biosynthesis protein n=1 Tax=Halobacillus sp. H74 TaxID=3457436 RepID=UPI003FCEAE3D
MNINWVGLHVFYHDLSRLDHLLVRGIRPIINELKINEDIQKYFFIRYWDGGPHVRVRLLTQDNNFKRVKAEAKKSISSYFEKNPSKVNLEPQRYYNDLNEQEKVLYENHTIKEFKYNPEYQRYGGEYAMRVAESFFKSSSDVSLSLIKRYTDDRNKLYSVAKDMMLLTACSFFPLNEHLIDFFKSYSKYFKVYERNEVNDSKVFRYWNSSYHKQSEQLKNQIKPLISYVSHGEVEQLSALYKYWFTESERTCVELDGLYERQLLIHPLNGKELDSTNNSEKIESYVSYVQSYIHMHNNRLGINPIEESYLAYLIYRTLLTVLEDSESIANLTRGER